ncbi:unnamed protein product, partial [Brenthis ino]
MFNCKARILPQAACLLKRSSSTQEPEVIFEAINNAGIITLNRPKVLNSVNKSVLSKMLHQMYDWENTKCLVIIKGAGDKAFCPGGDIIQAIDRVHGPIMFAVGYNVTNYIKKYKIPYVALIHGFAMGGGLGISVHGKYRVATEKTIIAMPEVKIGFSPDAGGSYFLPRLQDNLGIYLGLTGNRLKGQDVAKVGIATHFVSSQSLPDLEKALSKCTSDGDIQNSSWAIMGAPDYHGRPRFLNEPVGEFSLALNMKHIKYCFAASTVEEIIQRLEKIQTDWSVKTIKTLHEMCPGSLKITLLSLQRGAKMELAECLKMEYRITCHLIENHNFPEGVRALLIDKDNKPQWKPRTLAEVDDKYVESFFEKLPDDKELKFFDMGQKNPF